MLAALALLMISLAVVLYRDRDFWFPDAQEVLVQPLQVAPQSNSPTPATPRQAPSQAKKAHPRAAARVNPQEIYDPPTPPTTITRTVLPPLEVEVVAGDAHRTMHPGSNAVHVDLQRAQPQQPDAPLAPDSGEANSQITTPAADRTRIAPESDSPIVTASVRPEYPMLARQMKVQGSVILQALIGRDGLIQDLQVVSGPPILATAAREAVRQWHFKPHYQGSLAVETQAKITVNFTISTN